MNPVLAIPVNAVLASPLAVLATEVIASKIGRLAGATAASSAGSGDECTKAINAHKTTTDKVVFILSRFWCFFAGNLN